MKNTILHTAMNSASSSTTATFRILISFLFLIYLSIGAEAFCSQTSSQGLQRKRLQKQSTASILYIEPKPSCLILHVTADASYETSNDSKQRRRTSQRERRNGKDVKKSYKRKIKDPVAPAHLLTSRYVAVLAVMKIGSKKNTSVSSILEANQQFNKMSDRRDRAYSRMLVTTVERRLGQIDAVIDECVKKPNKNSSFNQLLKAALRVGIAQLLYLETPAHAAISETVEVVRTYGIATGLNVPDQLIKFVNGVLRNVSRNAEDFQKLSSPVLNLSPWFQNNLISDWGDDKLDKIAEQYMKTPHYLDLSFKSKPSSEIGIRGFDDENVNYEVFDSGSVRVHNFNGFVKEIPEYNDGTWWVQSLSASTPAIGLISSLEKTAREESLSKTHVIDMCAAPGGKTSQLLSASLKVTAIESSPRRIRRLQENLDRLSLESNCVIENMLGQNYEASSQVHGILLDAPCSATGTGIRRPDILQKDYNDIPGLLSTQKALAEHCIDNILDKGGILVYSTCSILKEESEYQAQALLEREGSAKVRTLPFVKGEIPGFDDAIDSNGWLRVLPGCLEGSLKDCDGFFVARFEKI